MLPARRLVSGLTYGLSMFAIGGFLVVGVRRFEAFTSRLNDTEQVLSRRPIGVPLPGESRDEVIVVLIGSSQCAASRQPELVAAFARIRAVIMQEAQLAGQRVVFAGVALDVRMSTGLRWLRQFGPLDEISIGRSWMNSAVVHLMWRDLAGPPSIPQIVVYQRKTVGAQMAIGVQPDVIRMRLSGLEQIAKFASTSKAAAGAPVPTPQTSGGDSNR